MIKLQFEGKKNGHVGRNSESVSGTYLYILDDSYPSIILHLALALDG